jgi:Hepatocellular carcinoma-associated antigen 59
VIDEGRMAYIDSELAKRSQAQAQAQSEAPHAHPPPSNTTSASSQPTKSTTDTKKELDVQRQPAALGKLLEIDLGDEARNKNVERTNQARRRLDGEEIEDEAVPSKKTGKVRLGRDGKPWRGRKRRASDDIKRDKLVEEVLRENRCKLLSLPFPILSTAYLYFWFDIREWMMLMLELQWRSTMSL